MTNNEDQTKQQRFDKKRKVVATIRARIDCDDYDELNSAVDKLAERFNDTRTGAITKAVLDRAKLKR